MSQGEPQADYPYRCPGELYPVSRAVHLGRLARFYPGCRQCPYRDDTGTLSPRQVRQLTEPQARPEPQRLFTEEGVAGVAPNELGPRQARDLGQALGMYLLGGQPPEPEAPAVIVGGDGRPLTAELLAAVAEGVRWTGCHVVEVGAASAPCVALAIDYVQAAGGILVGNPLGRPQTAGLKFWAGGPHPLSADGALDDLEEIARQPIDRPTRAFGSARRLAADEPYLATLAEYYHALRPLRFVLDTACLSVAAYLTKLTAAVACEALSCPAGPGQLGPHVVAQGAHFGIHVADDGEVCQLVDQQGRLVPAERLLVLLARHGLAERPHAAVVVEPGTPAPAVHAIHALGGRVVTAPSHRASMEHALRDSAAILGGGPSGRLWHAAGHAAPDALRTLSILLVLLSRSDRRLSEVLDAEAPLR